MLSVYSRTSHYKIKSDWLKIRHDRGDNVVVVNILRFHSLMQLVYRLIEYSSQLEKSGLKESALQLQYVTKMSHFLR